MAALVVIGLALRNRRPRVASGAVAVGSLPGCAAFEG